MYLNQILEHHDVSWMFTLLTLTAFFLALYVMNLTSSINEDAHDPPWIRWLRRASLAAVALSMLWSLGYSVTMGWQPWPPMIGLLAAVIMMLLVRALAIRAKIRREAVLTANRVAYPHARALRRN